MGKQRLPVKGYRMVFVSISEHASTAYFFASTSSDQICLASSEHLRIRKYNMANSEYFDKFSANFTRRFIRVRLVVLRSGDHFTSRKI